VLFVDISGFTRLVETLDPEDVYALVRPLMEELIRLVDAYDGEVQQILGDGLMCVFGLRATRGDEAERAVQAGRALVAAGRASLAVHAGMECGEVLVTSSWEPARFGVWGHAVNLAKRLCDLAGPGEFTIGPAAFAQVRNCIGAVASMRARVKGLDHSVVAYRVSAAVPALTSAAA
jgi:class 3 adenylate cyclase